MIIKENLQEILSSPEAVSRLFHSILEADQEIDRDKEHFWVIGLSVRNQIKYIEIVSLGILNANLVHPREVFRMSIMKGVSSIVVGHNHPSGSLIPSQEDKDITGRLREAGKILGIDFLDHIIIGNSKEGNDFFSFKNALLI